MNEKITVSAFANKYEAAKTKAEKSNLIKSIIRRPYVPFIEKITMIQSMLEPSFNDQDGIKIPNQFSLHTNFCTTVLFLYTSLEIDEDGTDDKTAALRAYDILQATGIWQRLFEAIGPDYLELVKIRDMYLENMKAENQITVQLAKQVTRFGTLVGTALEPLASTMTQELEKMTPDDISALTKEVLSVVK